MNEGTRKIQFDNLNDDFIYNKVRAAISFILMIALVISTVYCVVSRIKFENGDSKVETYKPMIVVSGSMLPVMQINSMCISKAVDIKDVKVGDIIIYKDIERNKNIVHRIIEIIGDGDDRRLVMKGDNNPGPDQTLVTSDILLGKIIYINNDVVPLMNLMITNERVNPLGALEVALIVAVICLMVWAIISNIISKAVAFVIVGNNSDVIRESLIKCRIDPYEYGIGYIVDDGNTGFKVRLARANLYRELTDYKTARISLSKVIDKTVKAGDEFSKEQETQEDEDSNSNE